MTTVLIAAIWKPLLACLLAVSGLAGLLALFAPRYFACLAGFSGRWIDLYKLLAFLDKPIDIDRYVLPHSRAFGAVVLVSSLVLFALLLR